jgi:hypothetical protein
MKDCPLGSSPFECPFDKPCAEVREDDWDAVAQQEEEDHGGNS